MQKVGFTELVRACLDQIVGGLECRSSGTPPMKGRVTMETTVEHQLQSAFRLRKSLSEELARAEIMSDRIPIREDIREVDKRIHELTREKVVDYIDESSLH